MRATISIMQISRRVFSCSAALLLAAPAIARRSSGRVPRTLDHIILGCTDLDAGIEFVFRHLGVRAIPGGVHPGAGTKNALLSLGELRYLEIMAPDPLQPDAPDPRNVRTLTHPALVGWAEHRDHLDEFASVLRAAGIDYVGPVAGSRQRPDGSVLNWKSLPLKEDRHGVLPFFIEWGTSTVHPSADSPKGCGIDGVEITGPDPKSLGALSKKLDLDVAIGESKAPRLVAHLNGPEGSLTLRSR
jgi:catechol 2,3-dioxygenase-like lactoylglutathione lyase family enzyme